MEDILLEAKNSLSRELAISKNIDLIPFNTDSGCQQPVAEVDPQG
jgi:hypothetical protein